MDKKNSELRHSEVGESLIGERFKVLDKGFVSLVSYHGTDKLVEAAARVSYQKGTRSVNDTNNLLRFLYSHGHTSPFEICNLTFHMKLPLYVIQQVLRHRTAKLNQESHRYSEISYDFHIVGDGEWRMQSDNNKQGSEGVLNNIDGSYLAEDEIEHIYQAEQLYKDRLEKGVAKEQARKDIPHSVYSQMYWQMDLKNLLGFMSLRCDSHAQQEIREYANVIAGIVKELYPLVFEAWYDYHYQSVTYSRPERLLMDEYIRGFANSGMNQLAPSEHVEWNKRNDEFKAHIDQYATQLGLGKRELQEFRDKFTRPTEQDFNLDYSKIIDMEKE